MPNQSPVRAWFALVALSIRRQARMRQMVWIAVGLLGLVLANVIGSRIFAARAAAVHQPNYLGQAATEQRYRDNWGMLSWRFPRRIGHTYGDISIQMAVVNQTVPWSPMAGAVNRMAAGTFEAALQSSRFLIFARWVLFSLFLSFLLPIWSLAFATESLGGEREARSLVWLFTRPLPRWSIYLAKFVGTLPWILAFNLGGFALICLAAGESGRQAFRLFWPGIIASSLAFAALFHFFGATFRRPTVVALVYSFFLETILGDMPGLMKRISITFYTRCLMFDAASDFGLTAEKPAVYQPVDGITAWFVLVVATVALLGLGMWKFSRTEYSEET